MKRYIKNASIFGMSFSRKEALHRFRNLSDIINEHVIECVVYKEVLPDTLHHWISEIATWIEDANEVTCKSKFKARDYADNLFGCFGTNIHDARHNLKEYKLFNARNFVSPYPNFEITDGVAKTLLQAYQALTAATVPVLLSGKQKSVADWIKIIEPVFK